MPSDASKAALAALEGPRRTYLSAVASTAEELRGHLSAHAAPGIERSGRVAEELGPFAGGRVNPERFAALLGSEETLHPEALSLMRLAESVLQDASTLSERAFLVELPPGADLCAAVGLGLAWLGRAFGAATAAEHARQGRTGIQESILADAFPFRRWNRAERRLAPPLVVEVEGSDLAAAGLAAYLDGSQKLVLVVRGPAPPAPLVRLISPEVLVLQTDDPEELGRIGEFRGPGVAALMPEDVGARFLHDPAGGPALGDRLRVSLLPGQDQVQALGSLTVWQQLQELRQLEALKDAVERVAGSAGGDAVTAGVLEAAPDGGGGSSDGAGPSPGRRLQTVEPADRLAGWLLSQADLSDLSER